MTTKKQRREKVAANRARFDAESKSMGEAALERDRAARERKLYDAERAVRSKKTALAMRKTHEATETKSVDPDLLVAYSDTILRNRQDTLRVIVDNR